MEKFVLYCKSYRNDVLRAKRLAESIARFNREQIPFYLSVPASDLALFRQELAGLPAILIEDEAIIAANPRLSQQKIDALPGRTSQQIVKSEFWRLGLAESYLCLDSDCLFIRPFGLADFIAPEGHPYTVMHEAKEFLQFARNHGMGQVCTDFRRERRQIMEIFGRDGRHYDFGPAPLLWSRLVWAALDEQFLQPKQMNFYDAIMLFPGEIQWYGEAMLKYRPYPLLPVEPYFKCYLYERQYTVAQQQGETVERLAENYLGVCYQSNWQRELDLTPKPLPSRIARWVRHNVFGRYR